MDDEYQTLERNGVQELVLAKFDEDGTPCVYLHDINAIFPHTQLITSCGAPVNFLCDASGKPKRPLRIPYLENRVIEVHGDDFQQIVWTRADLRANVAPALSTATAPTPTETQGTSRAASADALDDFSMLESGEEGFDDDDDDDEGSDEGSDELDDGEREDEDILDRFEEDDEDRQHQTAVDAVPARTHAPARVQFPRQPQPLQQLQQPQRLQPQAHNPHVLTRPPPSFSPVEQEHLSESRDSLPDFEEALQQGLVLQGRSVGAPDPERRRAHVLEPPPYESFGTTSEAADDQEQAHLLPDRIRLIKQACQSILRQQYLPTSCPHPPLFVILPVDPLNWSLTDILHNRMCLYFLCDSGMHSANVSASLRRYRTNIIDTIDKRDVHIVEDSGVELRLEEDNVRQFVAKFSHYMLYLLRMLRYGVTLDDVFVAAVHNQPTPLMSGPPSDQHTADGMPTRTQVFGPIRDNIDRAIQFIETYLGDDYDNNNAPSELIRRLSPEDFRVLDQILARSAASKAAKEAMLHQQTMSLDKKDIKNTDDKKHNVKESAAPSNSDSGNNTLAVYNKMRQSGLYRTVVSHKFVRWCCATHYSPKAAMDITFAQRAATVSGIFDSCLRSLTLSASSKDMLWMRVLVAKKIKHLTSLDITLDWDVKPGDLSTLEWIVHSDSSTISRLAIRFSGRATPLTIQSLQSTSAEPWPTQPRDRVINELLSLFKNTHVKVLELDGEIDLLKVPQIQTKDFSNLDKLSLMRQRTWEGDIKDAMAYHKLLGGFLESSCAFLSSIELGFPRIVPGHIRILQVCSFSLTSLRHLDLYRVLRPRESSGTSASSSSSEERSSPSSPSSYPLANSTSDKKQQQSSPSSTAATEEEEWRKLELSATFRASRVIRLQLMECRTNAGNKADFVESLRQLLHDDGAHLEELDVRYVGFNDSHAAALEETTRPKPQRTTEGDGEGGERVKINCRLRKLVIHGQGLTRQGAQALAKVLDRATEPRPLMADDATNGEDETQASASASVPPNHGLSSSNISPFSTVEYPRLGHLELRSIDSIDDAGWAELVSRLHMWSLITLDLHGFWFGSRGFYSLAASCEQSASSLPLRVLRLNCSTLDRFGVKQFQAWMPRLKELTTLGLYGFRNVDPALWMELLPKIQYRWLEHLEFICTGMDDGCADLIGTLLCEREPHLRLNEMVDHPPAYSPASSSSSLSLPLSPSPTVSTFSQSGTKPKRKPSLSFFSRSSIDAVAVAATAASSAKAATSSPPPLSPVAESCKNTSPKTPTTPRAAASSNAGMRAKKSRMPVLEVDLRYTDVSRLCLLRLKDKIKYTAQNVHVLLRDQEDEVQDEAPSYSPMRGLGGVTSPGPYATSTAGPPLPPGALTTGGTGIRTGGFLRSNSISSLASSASTSSTSTPLSTTANRTQSIASINSNNCNDSQTPRRTLRFGFRRK
ncbi:hypothetical protein BGZ73_004039 [Actinomortierella ambigua]|nr:hypothetical protein BGZ73_004039 [Actinomortierella ambigua]